MPQMAPMSWVMLGLNFFLLYFVFMSVIFTMYGSSFVVFKLSKVGLVWKW